jgi:serine-aspartate repeat-containing protein C/D/E
VTIYLIDQNGNYIDTTKTDLFGNYMFLDIPVGNYIVKSELNSSFAISPQDIGNDDSKDSDADSRGEISITFLTSSTIINADIGGVREYMKVGDYVWHDINGDGIQEVQEPGYGGILMNLVDAITSEVIYTTESSSAPQNLGFYEIPYVPIGNHYIHFVLPDSLCLTKYRVGADTTLDNDFTLINFSWRSEEFSTVLNTTRKDIDAGVFFKSTIGNYVWLDENLDGVQNQSEDGVNGVTVSVYNRQGNQVAEILTRFNPDNGKNGFYEFNDFVPGEFYVKFSSTTYNNFTDANLTSDDLDSDVTDQNGTGTTDFFTIVSHTANTTFDAGYIPNGILGSYLWNDDNGDGIQSEGENGLSSSKIYLYNSDMFLLDSTISDLTGKYHFAVQPGEYILMFDLPQNKLFTKSVSNALFNSDVTGKYGVGSTDMIKVLMYDHKMDVDAGFTSQVLLAAEDLSVSGKSYDEFNELFIRTDGLNGNIFIERMEDDWVTLNDTKPLIVSKKSSTYTFTDFYNSDNNDFYYRVKFIGEDKTEILSNVLHLSKYANSELNAYPSPFADKITISIPGEYEIFDTKGQLIKRFHSFSKNEVKDANELASGVYYLHKVGAFSEALKIVKL